MTSVTLSEPKTYWVHVGRYDASTYRPAVDIIRSMTLGEMVMVHEFPEMNVGFVCLQ